MLDEVSVEHVTCRCAVNPCGSCACCATVAGYKAPQRRDPKGLSKKLCAMAVARARSSLLVSLLSLV